MKFDYSIGNPAYQEPVKNNGRSNPVYNLFMDEAYKIANTVELITPARFLFDAGQTPKEWNEKMLNDEHFKVLLYEKDASTIFPSTEIKGGVAITLRDKNKIFEKIGVFSPYDELNHIYGKVKHMANFGFMDSIVSPRGMYRLTDAFFNAFPDAASKVGKGTGNMIVSNIFDKLPEAFTENPPQDGSPYYTVLGRTKGSRVYKYVKTEYVINNDYLDKYKVFFPEANGNGQFGETLTLPEIGKPNEGSTDTFMSVGKFLTEDEAVSEAKYIKTKLFRALLGIKKATQHTPKSVWSTIPIQNFTPNSDINWSASIHDIDQQLYRKYGLSQQEIDFIESHVKEMA